MFIFEIVVVVIQSNVFGKLATRLVFDSLTATPPHLAAPLGLMRATRPVEVLLLEVFDLAVIADLGSTLELPFSVQESSNMLLSCVPLIS